MEIALKYKIVEKIIQSDDEAVLNEIVALLGVGENDFWHDLPDNVKLQIDNAITQLDEGQGILHEDVMTAAKDRFLKK
jgi:hypothetical protein